MTIVAITSVFRIFEKTPASINYLFVWMDIIFNNDNQRTKYYYYFDLASMKTEK